MAGEFSRGFNTGFSLIDSLYESRRRAQLDAENQQDRELTRRMRELELRQAEQDASDRQSLRDAARPRQAQAGTQVQAADSGDTFSTDPRAASMVSDMNAAIADLRGDPAPGAEQQPRRAFSVDGQMFASKALADSRAAQMNTPVSSAKRVANELRAQGKFTDAAQLETWVRQQQKEGTDRLYDAIMRGQDGEAAKAIYNEMGGDRLGDGDTIEVQSRYNMELPGIGAIPTADIVVSRGGQRTVIRNIAMERFNLSDRALELAKAGTEAQRNARKDALDERRANASIRASDALAASRNALRRQAEAEIKRADEAARRAKEIGRAPIDYSDKDRRDDYKAIDALARQLTGIDDAIVTEGTERQALEQQTSEAFSLMLTLHTNALQAGVRLTPEEARMASQEVIAGKVERMGDYLVVRLPSGRMVPVRAYTERADVPPAQRSVPNPRDRRAPGIPESSLAPPAAVTPGDATLPSTQTPESLMPNRL